MSPLSQWQHKLPPPWQTMPPLPCSNDFTARATVTIMNNPEDKVCYEALYMYIWIINGTFKATMYVIQMASLSDVYGLKTVWHIS